MRRVPLWRRYLRMLGADPKADLDDEIEFHLQSKRDDLIQSGAAPRDAAAEAARRFGDVNEVSRLCLRIEKERLRKMELRERLILWLGDVAYAARQLRLNPVFALTAILTLALGIGANTAVFTLTDQVLLRLLPVKNPRELVQLRVDGGRTGSQNGDGIHTFSHPAYLALRDTNSAFTGLTGQQVAGASLLGQDRNEAVRVGLVAGNYFEVFGVEPYHGRLLNPADDRVKMGQAVVVLQYDFWRNRFAGRREVAGSTIRLNGYPFTVAGIAAPGFEGVDMGLPANMWAPVTMKPAITPADTEIENERYSWFYLFARLKPGVTLAQAEAAMRVTWRQRQEEELRLPFFQKFPQARDRFLKQTFRIEPAERGQSSFRFLFERPLIVLQWLVAAVLLIACSNIAGLLIARGVARQREIAIRRALGGSRSSLVRQLLVESLLIACAGGLGGILMSGWATRALLHLVAGDPSRLSFTTSPDVRILLFAGAVTLGTTMIFGLMPAWHSSGVPAAEVLKEAGGTLGGGRPQARLRKSFVAFQVALSTLLLIVAGLFTRTLGNLRDIDLGFQPEGVATFFVRPATVYDNARKLQMVRSLVEALAAVPGVKAVGANSTRLLTGGRRDGSIQVPGIDPKGGDATNSFFNGITPGYFEALGIPIKAGRDLTWNDWGTPRKYCLVNETLVSDYLGRRNAVGTRLGRQVTGPLDYEIIGVFGNARYHDPRGPIPRQTFFAMDSEITFLTGVNIFARTHGDPRAVLPRLREQVARVDSNLVVTDMRTLEDQLNLRLANERLLSFLAAGFALLALLLTATGLYGVLAFVVARRSREIGIRVALGASQKRVVRLVLREMAVVALAGGACGVAAGLACGQLIEAQLYGVKPYDLSVVLASVVVLCGFSMLAAALPALRASRADPMQALRQQ